MLTSSCESALVLADYFGERRDQHVRAGDETTKLPENRAAPAATFTNPTGLYCDSRQPITASGHAARSPITCAKIDEIREKSWHARHHFRRSISNATNRPDASAWNAGHRQTP
ncbi:MAG: hypothetical protein ACLUSL_11620 [Ruminococcus sp.]